ncbi:Spy/CpxP family protein refolding chaperone [Ancylobacter sp. A5.8]|uniref:Spy/CpxP family protein refolding chaperone n=1 Tax=Ancylobacter gelatini TaxID=2919920 RepID=UPI001F4D4F73|nr:Spy/CpxP family protein refolding chaperone [Ancylobacter gelatini]MCJ8144698.1 Spy/CpxP family protein refolding chaperone [Ancylobacter gelatini]
MKRTILVATAAALLASATFGVAASGPHMWGHRAGDMPRPSPEQMAENAGAFADARIAALKAGLRLTSEQEKLWPALETALRASSDQRIEARKEWREQRAERRGAKGDAASRGERPDAIEGLNARADAMMERGDALKKVAEAAKPLYASLDDAQKFRFNRLFAEARGERRMASFDGGRHDRGRGWQRPDAHHGPRHGVGPGGFDRDSHRAPPPPPEAERL